MGEKEDNIAKEKKTKELEEKKEKREKEREREREERSREMSQPNNPISRDTSPRRDNNRLDYPPPPPGSPPPDSRTSSPPPAGPGGAGDKVVATQAAMEQAQQLELQQKLMGARGGMRESKVLCLKNMVGSEEVDEQLQEEIEEECSKYGDVENVIIYQERQSEEEDAEILVKIFVEFGHPSHAKKG